MEFHWYIFWVIPAAIWMSILVSSAALSLRHWRTPGSWRWAVSIVAGSVVLGFALVAFASQHPKTWSCSLGGLMTVFLFSLVSFRQHSLLVWWKREQIRRGKRPSGPWVGVDNDYYWRRDLPAGSSHAATELEAAEPPAGRGTEPEAAAAPAGRGTEPEAAGLILPDAGEPAPERNALAGTPRERTPS